MRYLFALLILVLPAPPAGADEQPVSPAEFRSYAEGWTLHFSLNGRPYGSERFIPGGRTQWRFSDGTCVRGAWRPHGAQLCFLYDRGRSADTPLCWRVLRDRNGLFARLLTGEEAGLQVRVIGRDRQPLRCKDPATSA